jgi:hypothetical protein
MKKMLPFIALIGVLVTAFAQQGFDGFGHHAKNPAVKKYLKENVMPVLHQKRMILERELSSTEKNEIAECRTALKQLREQHKEEFENKQGDNKAYGENSEMHKQHKEIMQRLQAIADKHMNTLDQIKTDLQPVAKQWKEDLAKIEPPKTDGEKHAWHGDMIGFAMNHKYAAAHFLLMPVELPQSKTGTGTGSELKSDELTPAPTGVIAGEIPALSNIEISPTPASNELILGNTRLPAENQFIILDMQGKHVLTLQNVQAMQHLDVSQLPVGTYIAQIQANGQTVTRKVVISR